MANEVELEKMVVRLVGESASYQKMLQQAQQMTTQVSEQIAEAGKKIEGIGKSVGAFAGGATAALGAVTGGLGVTDAFMDFDKSMAYSTSVMGLTGKQTEELRAKVLSMAADTGKSATDLAKSFYYMASAGLNAEQAFVALPGYLKFATAGQLDLAQAVDLVSGVMGAARLKSEDANQNLKNLTRTTDVLAKISVLAQGNIQQFSEALSNDAAAAGQAMGKDIEEVTAVLGGFALANNRGASAGSDFARMLTFLSKAQRENAGAFKAAKIEVFDANGNMRNMADIIQDMEKFLQPMSAQMKGAALETLGFDARIQKLFVSTVGLSKNIREFEKGLREAGGTTADVSKQVGDTLAGSFSKLKNTVTLVAIEIGQFLAPGLRFVSGLVRSMVQWWLGLSNGTKQATVAFGMFGAVLLGMGPLFKAFSLLSPLITSALAPVKILIGLLFKLPSLWAAIGGAISTVVTAISGIGGFLVGLIPLFFSLLNPIKLVSFLFVGLKTVVMGLVGIFGVVFSPVTILIGIAAAAIAMFIEKMGGVDKAWEAIKQGAATAWQYVKDGWAAFIEWVKPITDALASFFSEAWIKIKQGVSVLWDWCKTVFGNLKDFVLGVWDTITGGATVNWKVVQETIRDSILFAEFTLNNFEQVALYTWVSVQAGFIQMMNVIQYNFTVVLPSVLSWFGKNWQDILTTAWNFATTVFGNIAGNIIRVITNLPGLIAGRTKWGDVWTPLTDGFENTIRELPDIPKREMGALETELMNRKKELGDSLSGAFDDFKTKKLASFDAKKVVPDKEIDKVGKQADKAGQTINKNLNKGLEVSKFDTALSNSMEALARIQDFRDKNTVKSPQSSSSGVVGGVSNVAATAAANTVAAATAAASAGTTGIKKTASDAAKEVSKSVEEAINETQSATEGLGAALVDGISEWAPKMGSAIWDFIGGVGSAIADGAPVVLASIGTFLGSLGQKFIDFMPTIGSAISTAVSFIGNAILQAIPFLGTAWGYLIGALIEWLGRIPVMIIEYTPMVIGAIIDLGVALVKGILAIPGLVIASIPTIAGALWTAIKFLNDLFWNSLSGLGTVIYNVIPAVVKAIGNFVMGILNALLSVGGKIGAAIAEMAKKALEAGKDALRLPFDYIQGKENSILQAGGLQDKPMNPYIESASGNNTGPEQSVAMNPADSSTQESILDVLKDIKKTNEDMLKKPELDIGTAGLA